MRSGRWRLIVGAGALGVVAVLVLALSGGGGDDTTVVSDSALADAVKATEQVPGSSISVETNFATPGTRKRIVIKLRGVQNWRQRATHLVGTYEKLPHVFLGAGGGIRLEIIAIFPHVYMRSPLFYTALPPRKDWVDLELAKIDTTLAINAWMQLTADPTQNLRALRTVRSRVARLGSEQVRGVPTTHYRATVELRRLPAITPPNERASVRRTVERLIQQLGGADAYAAEVWLDARHLVRRVRSRVKTTAEGRSVTAETTTELFAFGPKPRINPPPIQQTVDATRLAPAGSGP